MTIPSLADESVNSKCVKCGGNIALTAKFCSECGGSQAKAAPAPTKCNACGAQIPEYASFCYECGAARNNEIEATQADEFPAPIPVMPSPYGSPPAIGGTNLKRNLDGSYLVVKGRRIPRALLVLGAVVIVLVLVITLIGVFQQQNSGAAEQEQPSTAMGTPIGFDALWEKAYNAGSETGSGIEIGKRYQVTAAANDLTVLTSATSAYDHNAIYGDRDFDDVTQYESFLQDYRESEEANLLLVCNVVVSMGNNHKFRFHRVDGCHSAPKLTY
jgi:hypothetical protein